ncbi:MAG TPA: hypothetical protein VKV25_11030 [Acidimicrobiales bacterium]|nr:hypothetical protein [Acidimicrobiales bacterium]
MAEAPQAGLPPGELAAGQRLGSLIGALFGVIYLEANAGPLPAPVAVSLRLAGLVAGGVVVVTVALGRAGGADPAVTGTRSGTGTGFGRGYRLIVACEVVALAAGLAVLDGPLHSPRAGVAWVSFVVGAHLLPLSVLFRLRLFAALGLAIGSCGLAGLALAATGGPAASIAVVSGIVPGALLLGSAWYGAQAGGV